MTDAATTFEDWQLVLLSPWGLTGIILATAAIVAAGALTLWSYRTQRRWSVRLRLIGLRVLSLFALLFLVLQPAIQLRSVTVIPNHIAILVDASRSMAIRDRAGAPSRLEQAVAVLGRSAAAFERWRGRRVVDLFSFGASVRPLQGELKATEPSTQIWNALGKLRQSYQGKDLAAVIMLSDGIDNGSYGTRTLSLTRRRALANLEVPVHTVAFGSPSVRDVAVAEIYSDDFAFARNVVQAEADILVDGIGGGDGDRVRVTLESDGAVVAQREVRIVPGRRSYRVRFDFVPPRVGKYVYTIAAPVFPGEALPENNRRSFVLKVIRDRIRVLQVCGRPSWDQYFLRQLLKRDPNIDLISFFILRTPTDLSVVPTSELSLIPFPTEELFEKELGSFDLVVLQNFNYRPFGIGVYLPHLKRFVEEGGGLMMLGGSLSFSSGEYHQTPLAQVLPVELFPTDGGGERLLSEEDFKLRATREGEDHAILQVGRTRRETLQILGALPALTGANLVVGPVPGATVLAVHPLLKDSAGRPMPVLATREAGKGRTMALTTDTSWHWAFHSVGAGGTRTAYDRFWRNAIRWLIQDPELRSLRVIPQRDSVPLGTPIRAVVRAYNPDYSPARGLQVTYEVRRAPDGAASARTVSTDGEGEVRLEVSPPGEGAYQVRARAKIGGRETQEDALVLVEPEGPEGREAGARPALLEQIAEATGGRYLGQVQSLPDLEFREPRTVRVNWRRDVELWSRWWSLVAIVFLLGLEWWARRRFGYL